MSKRSSAIVETFWVLFCLLLLEKREQERGSWPSLCSTPGKFLFKQTLAEGKGHPWFLSEVFSFNPLHGGKLTPLTPLYVDSVSRLKAGRKRWRWKDEKYLTFWKHVGELLGAREFAEGCPLLPLNIIWVQLFFTHCWSVSKDFHLFGCHRHHDQDHDHLYDDQLGEKAAPRLAQSRPSSSVCSSTSSFYHFPIVYENELDDDTCQGYDILPPSLPFCNASGSEDTWYGWYGTVMTSSQMKIWSDIFTGQHCHRTQDFLRRSCSSQYPWWSRVLYIE